MAKIINQEFGKDWAFYNADCIFGMSNLPDNSIDFSVYSPPFAQLYIYSDSVADMGNSSDDDEFYEGYEFVLRELYRVTKEGGHQAIHCKDLMRYISSHGYSGQDDFPGKIVKLAEQCGWVFQCWITVWKNPVVEMQRTKTYGLLHKSFQTRSEVVRQGAPDIVLILKKQEEKGQYDNNQPMRELPTDVEKRIHHIWSETNRSLKRRLEMLEFWLDYHKVNSVKELDSNLNSWLVSIWQNPAADEAETKIVSKSLATYTQDFIQSLSSKTRPGRLCFIHCELLLRIHNGKIVGKFDMMGEIVRRFESQDSWKFHTRIALTDGTYLVGFRNWTAELKANYKVLNGQVRHNLKAPETNFYYDKNVSPTEEVKIIERVYIGDGLTHAHYVGNKPPDNWHDDGYYSILVWQKYASPVWFDLDGLPNSHKNAWMNIDQTNVLNFKAAKDPEDQKHICPLQLDLIERLVLDYSEPGQVIFSPYGGIGSEAHTAIKLGRRAIAIELKSSYWKQGCKYLKQVERQSQQIELI